jgi:hypothetical protein
LRYGCAKSGSFRIGLLEDTCEQLDSF